MCSLRPQNQKCNQIMDGSAPSPKSGLDPTQSIDSATKHTDMCYYYFVEFGGRMLLTVQHRRIDQCLEGWQPFAFAFFLVNVHQRELVPVDSLGDRAVFLSKDRCLCVSAKDLPSVSGNSVYFSLPTTDPVVRTARSAGGRSRWVASCPPEFEPRARWCLTRVYP